MDPSGLDFSPGLGLQEAIWSRFGFPVVFSPGCGLREFFLVPFFGRSRFRLSEDVVSLLLQSCLGGNAFAFKVIQLYSSGFKFSVASKDVGFLIYNLRSFSCKDFTVFFGLWGNGGVNWEREF